MIDELWVVNLYDDEGRIEEQFYFVDSNLIIESICLTWRQHARCTVLVAQYENEITATRKSTNILLLRATRVTKILNTTTRAIHFTAG